MAATIDYFLFWLPFWVDFFSTPSHSFSLPVCLSLRFVLMAFAFCRARRNHKQAMPALCIYIYTIYMYLYL